MTQLLSIDDDFHAALKLMSADPNEKRGMKAIVQDSLKHDKTFSRNLEDARIKMRKSGRIKHKFEPLKRTLEVIHK